MVSVDFGRRRVASAGSIKIPRSTNNKPGHVIRNYSTKQFRAVQAIRAHIRWCLSGTPIQNSLDDLGTLLKFLRVPILEETAIFRKHVVASANSRYPDRYQNLQRLLVSLCLRRTRSILGLPEPATETIQLTLSETEARAYAYLAKNWRRNIDMAVSGCNKKRVNQSILQCLMWLRIYCNHGQDISSDAMGSLGFPSDPGEALSFLQTSGDAKCEYCQCDILSVGQADSENSGTLTLCHHLICEECLPQYRSDLQDTLVDGRAQCPFCGHEGQIQDFLGSATRAFALTISAENAVFSTKIRSIVGKLELQALKDKR